jgi:hypothetical protein
VNLEKFILSEFFQEEVENDQFEDTVLIDGV